METNNQSKKNGSWHIMLTNVDGAAAGKTAAEKSVAAAVYSPAKQVQGMTITDTINEL